MPCVSIILVNFWLVVSAGLPSCNRSARTAGSVCHRRAIAVEERVDPVPRLRPVAHDDSTALRWRAAKLRIRYIFACFILDRRNSVPNSNARRSTLAVHWLKYWRSPLSLPSATDAIGLATAWKQIYNSDLGAGSVDAAHVALFQQAIEA